MTCFIDPLENLKSFSAALLKADTVPEQVLAYVKQLTAFITTLALEGDMLDVFLKW